MHSDDARTSNIKLSCAEYVEEVYHDCDCLIVIARRPVSASLVIIQDQEPKIAD